MASANCSKHGTPLNGFGTYTFCNMCDAEAADQHISSPIDAGGSPIIEVYGPNYWPAGDYISHVDLWLPGQQSGGCAKRFDIAPSSVVETEQRGSPPALWILIKAGKRLKYKGTTP